MSDQQYVEELAQRLVALEEGAYQEFAQLFGPLFLRYFARHDLPYFEAEDLAATCVTDIALKANRYRPGTGSFGAWAFTIAKNALADQRKKAKRAADSIKELELEFEGEPWFDIEAALEVRAVLAELPEIDQILVERRTLGPQQPYKELAQELGLTEEAARVRHLRALRRLEVRLLQTPAIQKKIEKERSRKSRKSA